MLKDYRCTKYSQNPFSNLTERKEKLMKTIRETHSRTDDIYNVVSRDFKFKKLFAQAFGNRCAYCGLLVEIGSLHSFQVDHIIASDVLKKGNRHKPDHSLKNLALSCQSCNNRKNNLDFTLSELKGLHPYKQKIKKIFYRDDDFYIKISDTEHNEKIQEFYDKLLLGTQLKRVDYLLMCLHDLANLYPTVYEIDKAYHLLLNKRSVFSPKET